MLTDNLANHVDEHKLVATEVIRTTVSVVVEMNCDYSVEHSNHRIFPIFPNRFNYSYREK